MNYYLVYTGDEKFMVETYFPMDMEDISNYLYLEGINLIETFTFNKISRREANNINCRVFIHE